MEEIKFRYRLTSYTNKIKPFFIYLDLEDIEGSAGSTEPLSKFVEKRWGEDINNFQILSRDRFTGLKDKNGKNGYEGDILQTKLNDMIWIYEIKKIKDFGNNLYLITRYRNFNIDEYGNHTYGDFFVNEGRSELIGMNLDKEIIGNIYENPELLSTNSAKGKVKK